MKKAAWCATVASYSLLLASCTSREDKYFPEFPVQLPIVVSTNQSVLVGEVYQPREICRVDSINDAREIYTYLRDNYSGDWKSTLRNYAPSYHIDFGATKITVSSGGITIKADRSNYLLAHGGSVSFNKRLPKPETFRLIKYLCPSADPAGPYDSPVVEVEIRNMSDRPISDLMASGGGQTQSIGNLQSLQTSNISLVPQTDSALKLFFDGKIDDRTGCYTRIYLTPSMHGKVEIDITENMKCEIRRDSTSLF